MARLIGRLVDVPLTWHRLTVVRSVRQVATCLVDLLEESKFRVRLIVRRNALPPLALQAKAVVLLNVLLNSTNGSRQANDTLVTDA